MPLQSVSLFQATKLIVLLAKRGYVRLPLPSCSWEPERWRTFSSMQLCTCVACQQQASNVCKMSPCAQV